MPSSESLLPGSSIRLFGRVLDDSLKIDTSKIGRSLGDSLKRLPTGAEAKLARIYGFSLDGQYVDLARPTIFLVHGDGTPVTSSPVEPAGAEAGDVPLPSQPTSNPTGLPIEPPRFADDLQVWEYDQEDFLLRIDVEVGPLERILLDAEFGSDRLSQAGAHAALSQGGAHAALNQGGAHVRLRAAGAHVRLRGGRGGGLSD